jgi:hypothetical protein
VVGVLGFESILWRVCSAIKRIRLTWSSAANLSFSSFNLTISLSHNVDGRGGGLFIFGEGLAEVGVEFSASKIEDSDSMFPPFPRAF